MEEPLPAGGSCLLGSINLSEFVDNPFTSNASINFTALEDTVRLAVRFLNEILDEGLPLHPLAIQRETVKDWRQIGLGIMGLADMLIKLGITYGSKEAIEICNQIGLIIANNAIETSAELAYSLGAYPKYDQRVMETEFFKNNATDATKLRVKTCGGLRNSQLLTIAPTGTLSTMLGISGGIEPIFANSYTRKTESLNGHDEYYKVYTPIVEEYMKATGIEEEKDLPEYFITSAKIPAEGRIGMQAAFQKHVDASISSTINLPHETTIEEVGEIYMSAWENGLKGVTIYRAGCAREGILVENEPEKQDSVPTDGLLPRGYIVDVSDDLIGYKRKLNTGCGSMHMEVYTDELTGEPQETFINIGSSGGCERNAQFISRLISMALRGGIPIEAIIDQASSIRPCPAYVCRTKTHHDTSPGTSCPSAIGLALKDLQSKTIERWFPPEDYEEMPLPPSKSSCPDCDDELKEIFSAESRPKCPECGEELTYESGCVVCKNCGYSKCE